MLQKIKNNYLHTHTFIHDEMNTCFKSLDVREKLIIFLLDTWFLISYHPLLFNEILTNDQLLITVQNVDGISKNSSNGIQRTVGKLFTGKSQ